MKHLILSLLFIISIYPVNAFGQCVKGDCENGQGTYKYSDGTKYKGQWKNGKLDGQGTYIYPDGSKYVGQFEDGQRNGQGTYIYPDGSKYVGQFEDGQRNGQGTYIYPDGSKYVGQWKNNNYIESLKSNEVHKPLPKKMAEEKLQKAESSRSSKVSKKTSKKRYHTVRSGESLWSISRRYGLTVKKVRLLNKLNDRSVIYPRQKLLVTF